MLLASKSKIFSLISNIHNSNCYFLQKEISNYKRHSLLCLLKEFQEKQNQRVKDIKIVQAYKEDLLHQQNLLREVHIF